MDVFVAGATGVLGRKVVPWLVEAGHKVRGVARGAVKASQLRAQGAEPVVVNLFDPADVARAIAGCEAVLHLATKIPALPAARKRGAWAENDRLRTVGTRVLVNAALASGAALFLKESVTFHYPDAGAEWITEAVAPSDDRGWIGSTYDAERETRRFAAAGGRGVVLRFGAFHDADSDQTQAAAGLLRRRIAPVFGAPEGYWSIVHVLDAAAAVVAALDAPSGDYNVVDDEPLTRRAYADAAAAALGLPRPFLLPRWLVARVGGGGTATLLRSQRVANGRFKQATGWAPRFPSARETWRDLAPHLADRR